MSVVDRRATPGLDDGRSRITMLVPTPLMRTVIEKDAGERDAASAAERMSFDEDRSQDSVEQTGEPDRDELGNAEGSS